MRTSTLNLMLLAAALGLSSCSIRSDAPAPRFLELNYSPPTAVAEAPAASPPALVSPVIVRLGGIDSAELLRLDLLHYTAAEVSSDPLWRWTIPPATALRQRLELAASAQGIVMRDRADLPLVTATVLRFGIVEPTTFTVQVLVRCRLADGTERSHIVTSTAPLAGTGMPGNVPQVAATALATVSADVWAVVRMWCGA